MKIIDSPQVDKLIHLAIEEDLSYGDLTADLLDSNKIVSAEIIARQELVVCGLEITARIAFLAGKNVEVINIASDGQLLKSGDILQKLKGKSSEIVSIERIVLNFLQRLSGVATYTRKIVDKSAGITILDTRKTMPGFRLLEKYATSVGGAKNHRKHLGEMLIIKNNHIDACEGSNLQEKFRNLFKKINSRSSFYTPFEIEIRNLAELEAALEYQPDYLMLDNMTDSDIKSCLDLIKSRGLRTVCEISGGISEDRLLALSKIGVQTVSMGSLTTKATNVDISLRITG